MSQGNNKSRNRSGNEGGASSRTDSRKSSGSGRRNDTRGADGRPGAARAKAGPAALARDSGRAGNRVEASLLIDSWYAAAIADSHRRERGTPQRVASLDRTLETRFPQLAGLAARIRPLRGLLWFLAGKKIQRVVCLFASRGLLSFLFFESLFHSGPPRVVLVEFLRPRPTGIKARLKEALHVRLCVWLLT